MIRTRLMTFTAAASLLLAACAGTDDPAGVDLPDEPPAAACLEGDPDCDDLGPDAPPGPPEDDQPAPADDAQLVAEAEALLGMPEDQLPDDVRIGVRGDEQMALTEDYVVGRRTVALEERDGTFVVTSVTVELAGGPHTVVDPSAAAQEPTG